MRANDREDLMQYSAKRYNRSMNIIITGTAGDIGRAIAERFLNEGHTVYGIDRKEAGDRLKGRKGYCHIKADIRSAEFREVPDPDVLISCAGSFDENEAIGVNLVGTMEFTKRFKDSPCLKSVLFIASASARNGAEFPNYSASKAGIVGYMKNLALELAKRGITCNSISPGGVITSSNQHILGSEKLYAAVKAETLLGKWAEPEEIADLAWYLTMINRSMTGEDLLIDNGEMLRSNFIW